MSYQSCPALLGFILAPALALSGCGSMPDITVGYYLPRASLGVTVTQTATCTDNDTPIVVTDVTFSTSFSRDESNYCTWDDKKAPCEQLDNKGVHKFDLGEMGRGMTKTDTAFEFYDDGRLKSLNLKQTGQAPEHLKALLELGTAPGIFVDLLPIATKNACARLKEISSEETKDGVRKLKPLTVIHRGHTPFPHAEAKIEVHQLSLPTKIFQEIQPIFGYIDAGYKIDAKQPPARYESDGHDGQRIELREPALATITVKVTHDKDNVKQFSSSSLVPQYGAQYSLPVQKSPWFGEDAFALVLNEAGQVTKIQYAGASGAAGAFATLGEAFKLDADETTEQEANRLKGEADLIYQQQRLVLCQTDPENCPK